MSDTHVRPARPEDIEPISHLLAEQWTTRRLPPGAQPPQADELAEAWRSLLPRADFAPSLLLVAEQGPQIVGFLASAPSEDQDMSGSSEIIEFAVSQPGQGHSSRLLAAWADLNREASVRYGLVWIDESREELGQFFASAGFSADGARAAIDHDIAEGATDHDEKDAWVLVRYLTSFESNTPGLST